MNLNQVLINKMASPQTENGFTRISNELLEELLKYKFPKNTGDCPFKICFFIIRKTYGYHKIKDVISLTQFEKGLNITRPTLVHWLNYLVKANLIVKAIKPLGSEYGLNKDYHKWIPLVKAIKLVKARKFTSKVASTDTSKVASTHKRKKENTKEIKQSKIAISKIFNYEIAMTSMLSNKKDLRMPIIAKYIEIGKKEMKNKEQYNSLIKRNLRPAKDLLGYSLDKIEKTMKNFKNIDYLSKWTLETVVKYIDEPEKPSNDIERDLIKKDLAGDMDNLNAGSRSAKRLGISFEEAMVLNKDLLK